MSDGWLRTHLSEVASLNPEAIDRKSPPETISYIDIAAVSSEGVNRESIKSLPFSEAPSRAQRIVRIGDVIVSTVRPYLRARALIDADLDGYVVSTGFCVIRPSNRVLPGFLDALTASDSFYAHLESRQTGSAYPAVRPSDLGDAAIFLAPIDYQLRAADLLAGLDVSINAIRTELQRVRQLAEPVRMKMLRLGGRSGKLRDFVVVDGIQIGPFGSQLHASDYRELGTPVVMPKDMIAGRIDTSSIARIGQEDVARLSRHQLRSGDILLARRGDLTKRAFVREGEAGWLCGTGSIRIRVPADEARLVFEAVCRDEASRWLMAHAVGTTMPNLNTEIVGQLPLVVPDVEAARPLLRVLEQIERLEGDTERRLTTLTNARGRVISKLLSGSHVIPESYDRFLADEHSAGAPLEPATV